MSQIPLKCECGQFRGYLENYSEQGSGRAVCYCDDCQAYAHALGKAKDVLDEWGGTDIMPVMPKQFKMTNGRAALLRLTPDGLFRFYAECCQSPIANAPNASLPYLGLVTTITDLSPSARDARLGRVHFRMQAREAVTQPPQPRANKVSFGAIMWMVRFMAKAFFKGGAKPTPFFDEEGQPFERARVLSNEERAHLRQFCGPAAVRFK